MSSKRHNVRLPEALSDFQDKMIASGRFKGRSAVTIYAYQQLMKAEGYQITGEMGILSDGVITRMVEQVQKLYSDYISMDMSKANLYQQTQNRQEWLGKKYPLVLDISVKEFIDQCINNSQHDFIGGGG